MIERAKDLMLGWYEPIDQLATAKSVRLCGHVLRVVVESVVVGWKRDYVPCRSKWSVGVNQIAAELRLIWPPSLFGDTTRF